MPSRLADLVRQGAALLADLAILLDEQDGVVAREDPITTWRAVADVLGVSHDTLLRRRRDGGVTLRKPWFRDAQACREWFAGLGTEQPDERPPPRMPHATGLTLAEFRRRERR